MSIGVVGIGLICSVKEVPDVAILGFGLVCGINELSGAVMPTPGLICCVDNGLGIRTFASDPI